MANTMQAACSHCGAQYHFDVSAIPAQGYDAQCTSCSQVFFVKPPAPQPAVAAPSAPIAVPAANTPIAVPSAAPISAPIAVPQTPAASAPIAVPSTPTPVALPEAAPAPNPAPLAAAATPEPAAPAGPAAAPAEDAQVEAVCPTCGARYQFGRTEIPEAGYDAQCTQCQGTFFVSPNPGAQAPVPLGQPLTSPPVSGDAQPMVAEPVELVEPIEPIEPMDVAEPIATAEPLAAEPALAQAPVATAPMAQDPLDAMAPQPDEDDFLSLSDSLGEPEAAPHGATVEHDFELLAAKRRKRLTVAGSVIIGAPLLSLILFFVAPGVFDATVGPVVGIKARIHPDAVPHYESAIKVVFQDTAQGYAEAIKALDQALVVDAQYPDAVGLLAMAHTLRGGDIRAQGEALKRRGQALVAEVEALAALPAKKRPKDAKARRASAVAEAEKINKEAAAFYEQAGDSFLKAEKVLRPALKKYGGALPIALATGIFEIERDADNVAKAEKAFEVVLRRLGVAKEGLKPEALEDPWVAYLKGRIDSYRRSADSSKAYFTQAVAKAPNFNRARYHLALLEGNAGNHEAASAAAQKILADQPEHAKAAALVEKSAKAKAGTAVAAKGSDQPAPAKASAGRAGKNGKAGRRKGKRRRRR